MTCYLTIVGENLDIDAFIQKNQLKPDSISRKGEPVFKTRPNERKLTHSAITFYISHATFSEFDLQVKDAIQYLKDNFEMLERLNIKEDNEIEYANLKFGVDYEYQFCQSLYFPQELLTLTGALGLSIEITVYTVKEDEETDPEI